MSHFVVVVIGALANLEKSLQPFHEFECTGTDDEYVVDVDETEERRAEYNDGTRRMIRLADGSLHSKYDDQFKVAIPEAERTSPFGPTERFQVPEGAEECDIPFPELFTFAGWLKDYQSYTLRQPNGVSVVGEGEDGSVYYYATLDEQGEVTKVVRRTNPNKKWDWWQVGGRWSGYFQVKGEIGEALRHHRALSEQGLPIPDSLLAKIAHIGNGERSWMNRDEKQRICLVDTCPKAAIDFEYMRNEAGEKAAKEFDKVVAVLGADPAWTSWSDVRAQYEGNIDGARTAYHDQAQIVKLQTSELRIWEFDQYLCTREQFVQRARDAAGVPFAILKDGQWFEKGRMGWWGMVSGEQDENEWQSQVAKLFDELPDDAILTAVDCHI